MRNSKFLTIILSLFIFSFAFAKSPELVIGIDTSGSMSKYRDNMVEVVKKLKNELKVPYIIYSFNDTARVIKSEKDIEIGGGTYPSTFLERVIQMKKKPKAIILITDGIPQDEEQSYRLIKKLKKTTKICTVLLEPNLADVPFIKTISDEKIITNNLQKGIKKCLSSGALKTLLIEEKPKKVDIDSYLKANDPMGGF